MSPLHCLATGDDGHPPRAADRRRSASRGVTLEPNGIGIPGGAQHLHRQNAQEQPTDENYLLISAGFMDPERVGQTDGFVHRLALRVHKVVACG